MVSYGQTIQRAFGDVSNALIGYDKYQGVRERQKQTFKDLQESVDVSMMRCRGGTANYLEVLDSQRSLFQAELTAGACAGLGIARLPVGRVLAGRLLAYLK